MKFIALTSVYAKKRDIKQVLVYVSVTEIRELCRYDKEDLTTVVFRNGDCIKVKERISNIIGLL